ncbi:MAG TPA: helix-turn-helix transcriptional regulator [Pirellulaceae bacterium]|jgi:DNA-binding NarL/FixJ family response regulator|nr:helix-turn-helix transcriptional regulator [Pirellulaceae bacterium]
MRIVALRPAALSPVILPELDIRREIARSTPSLSDPRLSTLTRREREVYRGIDAGLSVREIALLLSRSPSTIERHCRNAKAKLRVSERTPNDGLAWDRC